MTGRRSVWALLGTTAIASFGTRVSAIAIPWFVLTTSGSATRTGLAAAAELAPYVLVKAFAGPLTDRLGQRRVSVACDLGSAVLIGTIPVLAAGHALSFPLLLVLIALAGALRGPGDNAKHTLVPAVAEHAGLPLSRLTGLYGAVERGTGLAAPAVAALMIASAGPPGAIAVTAGCCAGSAVLLGCGLPRAAAPRPGSAAPRPESYRTQLAAGARFLLRERLLLMMVVMITFTNLFDQAKATVLLPVWTRTHGHGVGTISAFLTAFAILAVASSLLASWLGGRLPRRPTYFIAFAVAGPPPFLAMALDLPVVALLAVYGVSGLASGFLNPLIGAVLFERIPRPLLGRVSALVDAAAWAAMPFGGLLAAGLIGGLGLGPTLVAFAAAYALATAVPAFGRAGAELSNTYGTDPARLTS